MKTRSVTQALLAAAVAAGGEYFCFAQGHQVLGDVCLPLPEQGFQVAHAGLSFADGQQDLHARGLAHRAQELADFSFGFC